MEYALRAMACLALEPEERTSSSALAERTQVPSDYLAKVLQQLSAAGLIEGRRGVGGGYRLSRAPEDINLLDVINAVEPLERITSCPLNLESHGPNLCPLHRRMDQAIVRVIDVFEGSTLRDLLSGDADDEWVSIPLCDKRQQVGLTVNLTKTD
jgi:Rrf2 family protein